MLSMYDCQLLIAERLLPLCYFELSIAERLLPLCHFKLSIVKGIANVPEELFMQPNFEAIHIRLAIANKLILGCTECSLPLYLK